MFQAERVFAQRNTRTGLIEWFFNAREGVFGPYTTKDIANQFLKEFVERCKASGDDGGRRLVSASKSRPPVRSVAPLPSIAGHSARTYVYDDLVVIVFPKPNPKTGLPEWFFEADEKRFGPYVNKEIANTKLAEFIQRRKAEESRLATELKLSLETRERHDTVKEYDPLKVRKGIEG